MADRRPHAADVVRARACAFGMGAAIAAFERVHLVCVADFVARTDTSAELAKWNVYDLVSKRLIAPSRTIADEGAPATLTSEVMGLRA